MQRMMITLLIAFAVGIVLGKAMLPVLHKLKFGQNIYELAPEAHKKKQGTPTMGGLVIAGAAIVAALIMNDYSQPLWQNMLLAMLVMALGNLCIGFVDDMTKIRRGKNGGLTPKQKMFFQTLLALAFSCYCYFHPQVGARYPGAVFPRGMGLGHLVYPDYDVHHRRHDEQREPAGRP